MVLNWIWIAFFIIAFVIALVKLVFLGDFEVFPAMMDSTFSSSKTAFEISLGLTGVLALWLGIMKIGEKGGVVNILAKMLSPLFTKLFPDIPKGHPVTGSIFMIPSQSDSTPVRPKDISNAVFDEEKVESIMAGNTSKSPRNTSFTSAITKAMMKNAIQI